MTKRRQWGILGLVFIFAIGCISGCQNREDEIQNTEDALPVAEPGETPLPQDVLVPETVYTEEELQALSTDPITWGPGTQYDTQGRPQACVSLQKQYGQYGAYFLGDNANAVYLTFDEGYENGYTEVILDTLKEKQVSAVFFITMDYAQKEPELIRRMIDEGHVVGNHSTNHPNMTTLSIEQVETEVMQLHEYISQTFQYDMYLFRAPEGAISKQSMAAVQSLGYRNVLWSFAYHDWDVTHQMDPSTALNKACSRCHPGAIYLLHAVSQTNAEILGDFIDSVRAQGYEFGQF